VTPTPAFLPDIASVIRSKNAGPLTLSFDLMFPDRPAYERATRAPGLTAPALAELFDRRAGDVQVTHYAAALAIKIAMPRAVVSGSPGDRDVYGAQQHLPLLTVKV
jgi:hypothetical protein